jgi:pimeloyl-ACP methyl ester carboxylesterase
MAVTTGYLDVGGHPTWYRDSGPGPATTVVLLHGGLSNSDALLDAIGGPIGQRHRVVAFDRRGHGRTADTDAPFHYDEMAGETIAVLEAVVGGPAVLVGWSDGGIVALLVSMLRPDLVARQVLIGTNYHHDGLLELDFETGSEFEAAITEAYADRSPDGAAHFEVVMGKAGALFASEPTLTVEDLRTVAAPTLVLVGDDDLIQLSHTVSLYESLPAGRLAVVPGTSHAVPIEAPAEVAHLVVDFIAAPDPPTTAIPARRAPH